MAETLHLETDEHAADHGHDAHDGQHDDHHGDHEHMSDWAYVKIALILAFFTALEVGMFFLEELEVPRWFLFAGLTILMIVKFAMVAAYFMHLKFDTKWFTYVFVAGLVLALAVYFITFFAFDVFWGGDTTFTPDFLEPPVEADAEG